MGVIRAPLEGDSWMGWDFNVDIAPDGPPVKAVARGADAMEVFVSVPTHCLTPPYGMAPCTVQPRPVADP